MKPRFNFFFLGVKIIFMIFLSDFIKPVTSGQSSKRLNQQKKSKEEIFNEIAKKLSKVSLMDQIYCEIVVAYFIQLCEVYDEIPK